MCANCKCKALVVLGPPAPTITALDLYRAVRAVEEPSFWVRLKRAATPPVKRALGIER
jgi:hypothetical protein